MLPLAFSAQRLQNLIAVAPYAKRFSQLASQFPAHYHDQFHPEAQPTVQIQVVSFYLPLFFSYFLFFIVFFYFSLFFFFGCDCSSSTLGILLLSLLLAVLRFSPAGATPPLLLPPLSLLRHCLPAR
jgi:hypothetical protein